MPFAKGNKLGFKEGPDGVSTTVRLDKINRAILNDYLASQGIEPTADNCRQAMRDLFWHGFQELKERCERDEERALIF